MRTDLLWAKLDKHQQCDFSPFDDGASDFVLIVWNDNAEVRPRIRLSSDRLLSVRNLVGEPIVAEGHKLFLHEGMGPIYVAFEIALSILRV